MRLTTLLILLSFIISTKTFSQDLNDFVLKISNPALELNQLNEYVYKHSSTPFQFLSIQKVKGSNDLFTAETSKELSPTTIDFLSNHPGIELCLPNLIAETRNLVPNDEYFGDQWNLNLIGAPEVWSVMTGGLNSSGKKIVVAVIDTDFNINHPDLYDNIYVNETELNGEANSDDDGNGIIDDIHGYDFDLQDPTLIPSGSGHGTSVASVLGAVGNNDLGITGLNWNIEILPLKIKYITQYLEAQEYVRKLRAKYNETNGEEGAFIVSVNASLGFPGITQTWVDELSNKYNELGALGVLNVGSVPNESVNIDQELDITSIPSPYLISVTNTSYTDVKTTNAGYGLVNCDLGAPGGDNIRPIVTLSNDDIDPEQGGTSFASPLVSGTIALLYDQESDYLDEYTNENPAEVALLLKDIIMNSTVPLESLSGKTVSGGRLDLYQSLLDLHQYFQINTLDSQVDYIQPLKIIKIFPSPSIASQEIKIIFAQDGFEALDYSIVDTSGKLVTEGNIPVVPLTENQSMVTLQERLSSGVYILKLGTAEKFVVEKIIVH
jgi:subtilisin family serine protease